MKKTLIIAEIGINHNGDMNLAHLLIDGAKDAGADIVKFQKRTIDVVYTEEELDKPRESPWGTTNREQKEGLEFSLEEYKEIDEYCKSKKIDWTASAWDVESQKFLQQFDLKYNKVASAMITHLPLMHMIAEEKKHTFISTGMSNLAEIENVVRIFREHDCSFCLLHCNSTYPMKNEDANLRVIKTLQNTFACPVGYSGHETGRVVSVAAVAIGAEAIERHITLDKTMYGSDQAASLEIEDFKRLVIDIRTIEQALGSPDKTVSEAEKKIKAKLRRI